MARACRYFSPGLIWHITHRCHKREFLLKFARDRRRWVQWLFEAKKRHGLRILGYALTSNHIHLLVQDAGKRTVIPSSMDLIAGRTAQEYNERKNRSGAFWEDRYHATAIEGGDHLRNCMIYIDLNMVRAGIARHPREWPFCGYHEMFDARQRRNIIHWPTLLTVLGHKERSDLMKSYHESIETALRKGRLERDERWTESIAVGSREFVEKTAAALGARVRSRDTVKSSIPDDTETWILREGDCSYKGIFGTENRHLRQKNGRKKESSFL